jgi:hypothetical protein
MLLILMLLPLPLLQQQQQQQQQQGVQLLQLAGREGLLRHAPPHSSLYQLLQMQHQWW